MNGEIRRAKIENILKSSAVPVPGVTLAKDLDVSRQREYPKVCVNLQTDVR